MSTKNISSGSTTGTFAAGDDPRFADIAAKAAKGANSDITSLSGLTTALSVAQGGTGSATQNFVDLISAQTVAGSKTFNDAIVVPAPTASGHPTTKTYVDSAITNSTPDATTAVKGLVRLAGDLGGTAASPTVPGLANKLDSSTALTTYLSKSGGTLTGTLNGADASFSGDAAARTFNSRGILTSNTTNVGNAGKYTLLTQITLPAQYTDAHTMFSIVACDGGNQYGFARVDYYVRQQAAFGSDPVVSLRVTDCAGQYPIVPTQFVAIVTQNTPTTIIKLYGRIMNAYEMWAIAPFISNQGTSNNSTIAFQASQPFVDSASLPAGTQTTGVYFGQTLGTLTTTSGVTINGVLTMGNTKIVSVADPTNAQDAATKNYIDLAATTKAAKGANSDITSLTGLTTALSLAQGGTGATTATAARTNLGLGGAALLNVGTASGTVAAGDDSRFAQITTNAGNIAKLTLNPTATKTAAYTAAAQELVLADATSAAFTVTLPTAPADGTLVEVKKLDSGTNAVTVVTGGSDTYSIGGTSLALAVVGQGVTWRYQSSTTKWIALSNDLPLAAIDIRYLQQTTAATTYAPLASPAFTGTVSGITKTMVGLGNVDNVADANKPVSTAQAAADTLSQSTLAGTNTQTGTAYTLVLADAGKVIEMNNASANTLTVPTNATIAYPVATIIEICQVGAGQTTIAAASGVILRSPNGLRSAAQYATISLRKRATDEWVVSGYTAP